MDREGKFNDPSYIEELRRHGAEPSRQNIMPFSTGLASLETIQFAELVTNIGRHGDFGQQPYDYYTGELRPRFCSCAKGCEFVKLIARGDTKKPFLAQDISKDRDFE
jgi:hypothetical protein